MAKRSVKRKVSKNARRTQSSANPMPKKIKVTLNSLLISLVLFIVSWIGYEYLFLNSVFVGNLFFILEYIFGFLSLAFFIALLVLLALKTFKK